MHPQRHIPKGASEQEKSTERKDGNQNIIPQKRYPIPAS